MLRKLFSLVVFSVLSAVASVSLADEAVKMISGNVCQPNSDMSAFESVSNVAITILSEGEEVANTQTDENGDFEVKGLEEGNYVLIAEKVSAVDSMEVEEGNFGSADVVVAYNEEGVMELNFVLTENGVSVLSNGSQADIKNLTRAQMVVDSGKTNTTTSCCCCNPCGYGAYGNYGGYGGFAGAGSMGSGGFALMAGALAAAIAIPLALEDEEETTPSRPQ